VKTLRLNDEQAKQLTMMLDCIEYWGINSRGVGRLWEENKELIEELAEQLYEPCEKKVRELTTKYLTCLKRYRRGGEWFEIPFKDAVNFLVKNGSCSKSGATEMLKDGCMLSTPWAYYRMRTMDCTAESLNKQIERMYEPRGAA